ncbi:unnamed protein product, partial [Polarella glacialis]
MAAKNDRRRPSNSSNSCTNNTNNDNNDNHNNDRRCRKSEQHLMFTSMCTFFAQGTCKRGSACKFAHDEEQLRQKPVFFKTRFCAELLNNGYCPMGADCKYAHDAQDMQPSLAKSKASAQGGRQHLLDKEDDSTSWTRTCSTDLDLDDAKSWVSSRSSTK